MPGFQGLAVPIPLDEFETASTPNSVCRAASSTASARGQQVTHCAGDKTQTHLQHQVPELISSRAPSYKSDGEYTLDLEEQRHTTQVNNFDFLAIDTGADGPC